MNTNTRYTYPCLFCGDNTRNRTEEHIIQHGFKNSRWVLDTDVCCHCNTDIFSPLDKKLIDFVHTLIYPNHPYISRNRTLSQTGHSIRLNEKDGIWQSLRIDSNGKPIVFPQIIFVDENKIEFFCNGNDNYQQQMDIIKQELVQVDKLSLKELVFQKPDQSLPPIQSAVIRTAPMKYVLRASTNEEVQLLKYQIQNGQLMRQFGQESEPRRATSQKSEIHTNLVLEPNLINRAIAKSAVNAVCYFLGSQRARNSVLDPIKSFILGDTQEEGDRFVQHIWKTNGHESNFSQKQNFALPGHHTLILASRDIIPIVLLNLYGHPFACIRLTEDTNFMDEEEIYVALIDYRSGSHEVLNPQNDPVSFYQRFYVDNTQ
jgi:hypothetical protein